MANLEMAKKIMKSMVTEFTIAKELSHPNIIEQKYFMKKYDLRHKTYEFHLVMEYFEGKNAETFIK